MRQLKLAMRRVVERAIRMDLDLFSASTRKSGWNLLLELSRRRDIPISTMAVSIPQPYLNSPLVLDQIVSLTRFSSESERTTDVAYPGIAENKWQLRVPARYSMLLSNVRLDLRSNSCCMRIPTPNLDGQRLVTLGGYLDNGNPSMVARGMFHTSISRISTGEGGVVMAPGGYADPNYFHWIHNWLPTFLTLVQSTRRMGSVGNVVYPVFGALPSKVREVLAMFPQIAVTETPTPVVEVENFCYIDPSHQLFFSEIEINLLREFRDACLRADPLQPSPERLYVSRSRSSRSSREEVILERLLESRLGFAVIHAEDLSLSHQQSVFRNARVVAGFHGAGLSNMVWCEQKALIIEIARPSYSAPYFAIDAQQLGHDYHLIWLKDPAFGFEATDLEIRARTICKDIERLMTQ